MASRQVNGVAVEEVFVAGRASAFTPTANSGAGTITLANTDYTALVANTSRTFLMFTNTHASASITVNMLGSTAYSSGLIGVPIPAGGSVILDVGVPNTAIHVASATAGATYFIMEG